ncbi:NACHT, LRR and PYD domains-containing protein 3-like [Megalobrama amblycephala]|uniref:NACHT, LRR and PYD domains-containing protein 3-like n=1 Tax=Megalobrama amblycephala TaxID=75352 RepID=UPI0020146E59|nr:NACHT, LRR and PYD domains-containing protein 3-like [Megalobrama amblycephala]
MTSEHLLDTLDALDSEKLKRFKWHLKQDAHVSAADLESADAIDTVDLMMACCGPERAVKITLSILRKMRQNHLAEELENETKVHKAPVLMSSSAQTGVSVDVKAETGASVNAPVLTGNTMTGQVIIYGSNAAGNDQHTCSETAEKHTEKQEILRLQKFLENHKTNMKKKAEHIFEGKKENKAHLKDIYTELFITEGDIEDVNQEHEILKIDDAFKNKKTQGKPIKCNDMFRLLRENSEKNIVLTKGIAGIGKTVSVYKFILDWAEGKDNQDIHCVFLLPFREINMLKNREVNLNEFLQVFYPELKELDKSKLYAKRNLFIFDGLDESRLPINFKSGILASFEERSSVDVLFTNLVKGTLFPSALVWVTSRPAAANQIHPQYVGLFTEVRGFSDEQKEEYFRKRIKDETQASRIISHIKTSRSLYIMCHIPVFCWITAKVLQNILIKNNAENISTTLTEMYIHFLLIQMNMKNQKYDEQEERRRTKLLHSNREMILKLAKLAFEQLKRESIVFYEKDLEECGIDVDVVTEFTGMLAEIFMLEDGLHETKVFCFVHLSVQEFLAAVHVFLCYLNKNMQELQFFFDKPKEHITLQELLQKAVDKAMKSQRGHLDLFLRFLMGISLKSSQNLLQGLITHTEDTTESITKTSEYIKRVQDGHFISDEASVNLFYCLLELKDHSLYEEIQRYLSSDAHPGRELSSSMCTVLTYVLLMSEKVLDEFNPKMFTSSSNYTRLVSAVGHCRKALFNGCDLSDRHCESLSKALQSSNSHLREMDLSNNLLKDSGVRILSTGLRSSHCQLNILRLSGCMVTEEGCSYVSSALSSNPSHLRELDLSYNYPGDSGVKLLSDTLNHPNYRLDKLNVDHGGEFRITAGPRKYACFFTLDPSTANTELILSEGNRKVTCVQEDMLYIHHAVRYSGTPVLCRESVCGQCYWELEWSGRVLISVSYKSISRKGWGNECVFGSNDQSWSLFCSIFGSSFRHNSIVTKLTVKSISSRIGVYVDHSAGTLSFYSVSGDTVSLIHTVQTTFTQPLYPGFEVFPESSVKLC